MLQNPPIDFEMIEDMVEGDEDFKSELVSAILHSLLELKEKYQEGATLQNAEIIQQIRHKTKPTLTMFGMERLTEVVNAGKVLIEEKGFEHTEFPKHLEDFLESIHLAIEFMKAYISLQEK
ncbi:MULTISPECIES: hypothetical protein [Rhodonellum]|nr:MULTISPECIES: hypothetical protein [Rhodonellum]SDZ50695.1 hypothetical protein SAMN05444412_11884 [Rhodonellum ikkaensis]